MQKTLQIEMIDQLKELYDSMESEHMGVELWATSREDSYMSGINEGIDRCQEKLENLIIKLGGHV